MHWDAFNFKSDVLFNISQLYIKCRYYTLLALLSQYQTISLSFFFLSEECENDYAWAFEEFRHVFEPLFTSVVFFILVSCQGDIGTETVPPFAPYYCYTWSWTVRRRQKVILVQKRNTMSFSEVKTVMLSKKRRILRIFLENNIGKRSCSHLAIFAAYLAATPGTFCWGMEKTQGSFWSQCHIKGWRKSQLLRIMDRCIHLRYSWSLRESGFSWPA